MTPPIIFHVTSSLQLVKFLFIFSFLHSQKEVYGSIEELMGRYIAPMNDRVEEVQHHRKFLDKLEDEVDGKLQLMKKSNPAGVFYFICWSESYPGYISLRYIINRTPRHHTIGISPDGFVWGPKTYVTKSML